MNMFKNGMLNACAESAMMGNVVKVSSPDEVKYVCGYIVRTLKELDDEEARTLGDSIYEGAMKYNTNGTEVQYITVNSTDFGVLITLVRDETLWDLTTPDGVLAYVYNLGAPECSELGYVFFRSKDGRIVRFA